MLRVKEPVLLFCVLSVFCWPPVQGHFRPKCHCALCIIIYGTEIDSCKLMSDGLLFAFCCTVYSIHIYSISYDGEGAEGPRFSLGSAERFTRDILVLTDRVYLSFHYQEERRISVPDCHLFTCWLKADHAFWRTHYTSGISGDYWWSDPVKRWSPMMPARILYHIRRKRAPMIISPPPFYCSLLTKCQDFYILQCQKSAV